MLRHTFPSLLVAVAFGVILSAPIARAGCGSPYFVSSNATVQSNPDWCGGYGCYDYQGGPPLSDDVASTFWALGSGDPIVGQGDDDGRLDQVSWFASAGPPASGPNGIYYYSASFDWSWGEPAIDGCVLGAGPPGDNCSVVLFSDQLDAVGYFALLSDRSDALGHFAFDRPGGAPFVMTQTPRPAVVGTARIPPVAIAIEVAAPTVPTAGLYLDPNGCDTDAVVGYRVYVQGQSFPGSGPPLDRRREQWQLASGAAPVPIDQNAVFQIECGSQPLWLAQTLVFDSGYELAHVSEQTGQIICDPFCTDLDNDGWCLFNEVPDLFTDCNDTNPTIHPFAPELNDGLDNQCPGSPGFGLIDEISGETGFTNPADRDEFGWPVQGGATLYEVARTTRPDDAAACALETTATNALDVGADPDPGGVFHLLVRAVVPFAGSWGASSAGIERTFACP